MAVPQAKKWGPCLGTRAQRGAFHCQCRFHTDAWGHPSETGLHAVQPHATKLNKTKENHSILLLRLYRFAWPSRTELGQFPRVDFYISYGVGLLKCNEFQASRFAVLPGR